MKRWLFLLHRWLGVFGCLLIALWFVTGFVMMYVPFPSLTATERFAHADDLDLTLVKVSPLAAVNAALTRQTGSATANLHAADDKLMQLRLIRGLDLDGRGNESSGQLYAVRLAQAGWLGVDAMTGRVVSVGQTDAARAAQRFAGKNAPVTSIERIVRDQWSVPSRFDAHRPLWAVHMADGGKHYVSSRTGEVVLDTATTERGWNWVGAVVHWIYPTVLRSRAPVWHWVVVVLSSYSLLTAIMGLMIGILRWKKYASGNMTPYRGIMRWHHLLGLGCALFVLSWLLSGLLSMNPFNVFASRNVSQEQLNTWRGITPGAELSSLPDTFEIDSNQVNVKEIEWFAHAQGVLAWLRLNENRSHLMQMTPNGMTPFNLDHQFIEQRAALLGSSTNIVRLDHYDTYYDARHRSAPLPIWRIKLDDANQTWLHVDGTNGQLLGKLDKSVRAERWLYNGLHSWDFEWLITSRPLWDIAMLLALLLGTVFSTTSVVIGWRRLRSKI